MIWAGSVPPEAPVGCSSHRHGDRVAALSGYLPLVQSSMFNPVRPPHRTASNPRAELILKSSRESQRPPLPPSSSSRSGSRAAGGVSRARLARGLCSRDHTSRRTSRYKGGNLTKNMVQLLTFHPENVDEENETNFQNREYLLWHYFHDN